MRKTGTKTVALLLVLALVATGGQAQVAGDQPAETPYNTASMTTSGGKTFKLVLIGDCLPQLWINGEKMTKKDLAWYQEEIEKLTAVITAQQKKQWARTSAIHERTDKNIIDALVQRKVVGAAKDVKSFYLTDKAFVVNGKRQEAGTFVFFRDSFVGSADNVYYYESPSIHKSDEE